MTREDIEQLNVVEPYCFESDREEQWYNIGLKHGLEIADEHPKSPWVSVKDDLPCKHNDLLVKNGLMTKRVIVVEDNHIMFDRMAFGYNRWDWVTSICPSHWFVIPELPKE